MYFVDNLCVPRGAPNQAIAEKFLDYLLRPENSARNMTTIGYAMPNPEAVKLLPPALANNALMFTAPDVLARCQLMPAFEEHSRVIEAAWLQLKGE